MGASAGGLEAFISFIKSVDHKTGSAYVFVQHLDPTHPSLALEILSKETKLKVVEIKNGMRIAASTVYLQPSNSSLEYVESAFKLIPRSGNSIHLTIDNFFISISNEIKSRLIGVILSGTGSDGTYGLNAIKANGGTTFVQTPETAKYSGMPNSAIAAGAADFILTPEDIATELHSVAQHSDFPLLVDENAELLQKIEEEEKDHLREIFQILQKSTLVDFNLYKSATVIRRMKRRMILLKFKDFEAYKNHLKVTPTEIRTLYDEILIHVTEFFRDPLSYEALKKNVFPKIIKNEGQQSPLRIWIAGCSTGEEVYSLAMAISEYLESINQNIQVQIFATDISEHAIHTARLGIYSTVIEKYVSDKLLNKYFKRTSDGYKVNKSLRDLCLFSKHDMTSDPPFARLDLITCRNVLIYFSLELQKKVIPTFHYALKPNGFLWLGKSETCGSFTSLFSLESKTHKYYTKKEGPSQIRFSFPAKYPMAEIETSSKNSKTTVINHSDFQREADKIILARFSYPSVVINNDLDILQFRGRTVPFLEPSSGMPCNNLLKMARPELQAGLRLLIKAVKKDNKLVKRENFCINLHSGQQQLSVSVLPVNPSAQLKDRTYLVIFIPSSIIENKNTSPSEKSKSQTRKDAAAEQEMRILVNELAEAKESQQSLIEEYDVSQEELTSANEELQSSNEELQSTNEELETAKEELQSTNEELTTVNEELQLRNLDLTNLGSDLSNLLSSTEIPILMVGGDGRIRRFTGEAKDAFNLISSDIGRPISDIKSNFGLDLVKLLAEVGRDLQPKKIEVQDQQGSWKHLQIRPYRTLDNKIDGVSIALLDIDQLKQKENNFKQSLDYIKSVADSVPLPFAVIGHDYLLKTANRSFYKYFNIAMNANGKDFFELLSIPDSYRSSLKLLIKKNISTNTPFADFEINCKVVHSGTRKMLLSGGKVQWVGDEPEAALISFIDITERSRLEGELTRLLALEREARGEAERANKTKDVFLATLSHELRTPLSAILTWSQLIGSDRVDEPTKRHGASVIEQSAKTQSQLIDDLLDISRIISGKLSLTIKDVNPAAVIRSAVESVLSLSEKKNLKIEAILSPESGLILADIVRLHQIIWNLLTNAIKFSPKDGRIEISLEYYSEDSRRFALIKVIDHGKGIPTEFLPNVFNRFSQADSASTRIHGGLGLGLSIVRNLVELQGGTVSAENGGRGVGAILSLQFPVIPNKGDILHAKEYDVKQYLQEDETLPCLDGIKILFVDDNDNTRDALIIYLKSYGANVRPAESVKTALKLFSEFKPDILISDIAMPTEDGYSLIRRIRKFSVEKGGRIPAIALTAYANTEDSDIAIDAGFSAHVAKPVEAAVLALEIIRTIKEVQRLQNPMMDIIDKNKKN